jgi:Fe-Mn family superoxide dismutase
VKAFLEAFSAAAGGHFASGWAWLVFNFTTGRLEILETHDADSPISQAEPKRMLIPIFVCDVWEHAYYVDFRNDRVSYVKAFWSALNWNFAEKNFAQVVAVAKL